MKILKTLFTSGMIATFTGFTGCGLFHTPPSPTPNRMNQNINRIASGTVVTTVAVVTMDIPNPTQPKVVNSVAFRVTDDVRDSPSSTVLIPKNALITGVYTNDGTICLISWQLIYHDYQAMEKNQATLSIAELTNNNTCDPKLGIKAGQIANITFK